MKNNINCIDLFCGAGGLSHGFEQAGYNVVAGIDSNKDAIKTFQLNHKDSKAILFDLSNKFDFNHPDLKAIKDTKVDIIIGGPPCQGFSIAGKRLEDDPRNILYKSYMKFIDHYNPKVVLLENVPTIMSLFKGAISQRIISSFEKKGYSSNVRTLDSSLFGVPQKRRRTFFIFTKKDEYTWPDPTTEEKPLTTKDAISDLPKLNNSLGKDFSPYKSKPKNPYQELMRKDSDGIYNHISVNHTEKTKNIISLVPDGGNYKSLPKSLQTTRKVNIAWTRMNSKKPCFTIDAGHNHHFHYKENRVPTVRECARIQSFNDSFIFCGNKGSQYRQVGNAVPPILGKVLAESIKGIINDTI